MAEWCCMGFQGHVETAGERGVSVIGGFDSSGNPEVFLQFQSVDEGMESGIPNLPFPISIKTDIRIKFCPWCGADVAAQYGKHLGEVLRTDLRVRD